MVLGDQQYVLVVAEMQQLASDQRTLGEIEWRRGLIGGMPGDFRLQVIAGEVAQVVFDQSEGDVRRMNLLTGPAVAADETSSQNFVARHDTVKRCAQGTALEPAL
jgi:hypothetical protein